MPSVKFQFMVIVSGWTFSSCLLSAPPQSVTRSRLTSRDPKPSRATCDFDKATDGYRWLQMATDGYRWLQYFTMAILHRASPSLPTCPICPTCPTSACQSQIALVKSQDFSVLSSFRNIKEPRTSNTHPS